MLGLLFFCTSSSWPFPYCSSSGSTACGFIIDSSSGSFCLGFIIDSSSLSACGFIPSGSFCLWLHHWFFFRQFLPVASSLIFLLFLPVASSLPAVSACGFIIDSSSQFLPVTSSLILHPNFCLWLSVSACGFIISSSSQFLPVASSLKLQWWHKIVGPVPCIGLASKQMCRSCVKSKCVGPVSK